MRRYYVFDCTRQIGGQFTFWGPRWLAHMAAVVASWATGRFHDYAAA